MHIIFYCSLKCAWNTVKKVLNNSGLIVSHDMDGNFMHWDGVQGKKIWHLLLWFPVQLSQSYRERFWSLPVTLKRLPGEPKKQIDFDCAAKRGVFIFTRELVTKSTRSAKTVQKVWPPFPFYRQTNENKRWK